MARVITTPAPSSSRAPSSFARAIMSPRSVTSRESTALTKSPVSRSLSHCGERERSSSSASSVETMRAVVMSGAVPRVLYRSCPTTVSATRSSTDDTPSPSESSRLSSSGDAAATARTAVERSITATLASSTFAAARATAGSPAPDSTASDRASSGPAPLYDFAGAVLPAARFALIRGL